MLNAAASLASKEHGMQLLPYWKPVPGYEGRYEISNMGVVRTIAHVAWNGRERPATEIHVLMHRRKPSAPAYAQVNLWIGHQGKARRLHALVATVFHGEKPDPTYHACHNNGSTYDNRASNVRWDTPKANTADIRRHGRALLGERNHKAKLTTDQVRAIRQMDGKFKDIGAAYGISGNQVSFIKRRKCWAEVVDA